MHTCIFTFLHIHSHITYKWWNNKIVKICSHVKMQILRNQVCITTLFNSSFRTVTACWDPKRWDWFKFASPLHPLLAGRIHDGLVRRWAWLPQRNFSFFSDKLTGFDLKQRLPGMMIPVDYTIFLVEMSANQWNIYRQVCCLCWLDFAMDVGHVPGLCENLCIVTG